ncbi:hypothetical protein Drose_23225 [Dactylosporangium roseum]|uniref:Uncharacterized protein n=1 Tax=Dactylosporangium roseum TaxID=47989 RepID=A0ABY5Z040_9ACTN|nr:hypothetical protein [Dactylosporangium roseum]UWZ34158.1 hypothetical protein Drose_23225 [Dactylosporangium roseum]
MTATMTPRTAPRPGTAHVWLPTTDTGDAMLRLCRAERRIEALAAAARLLCGEGVTDEQRRAAELLDEVGL